MDHVYTKLQSVQDKKSMIVWVSLGVQNKYFNINNSLLQIYLKIVILFILQIYKENLFYFISFISEFIANFNGQNDVCYTNIYTMSKTKSHQSSWKVWQCVYQGAGMKHFILHVTTFFAAIVVYIVNGHMVFDKIFRETFIIASRFQCFHIQ